MTRWRVHGSWVAQWGQNPDPRGVKLTGHTEGMNQWGQHPELRGGKLAVKLAVKLEVEGQTGTIREVHMSRVHVSRVHESRVHVSRVHESRVHVSVRLRDHVTATRMRCWSLNKNKNTEQA